MRDYSIGVDFHKKFSYIAVKNSEGQLLRAGRSQNCKRAIESFLKPYLKDSQAVIEVTRNWPVMYDWLEDIVDEVKLANPLKIKAIAAAKIKTDKIDANILSDLLRADLIPEVHVPCRETREMRSALRERMFFVRLRTMVKNRIYTIFDRYPEETEKLKKVTDLFGKEGRQQLAVVKVSDADRILVDRELQFIDELNGYIKETEKTIKQYSKGNQNVTFLKSIPGIGEFFARLINAEIDTIDRFANAKKLAAYAGLVPSTYSSGGHTNHGKIIKGGNKWIRWALVEAVIPAIKVDEELREDYERIKQKSGYNKAKVAIARKLLTITYKVLKEKRTYKKFNKLQLEYKRISLAAPINS